VSGVNRLYTIKGEVYPDIYRPLVRVGTKEVLEAVAADRKGQSPVPPRYHPSTLPPTSMARARANLARGAKLIVETFRNTWCPAFFAVFSVLLLVAGQPVLHKSGKGRHITLFQSKAAGTGKSTGLALAVRLLGGRLGDIQGTPSGPGSCWWQLFGLGLARPGGMYVP
jgi:hypothetical protein